MGDDMILDEELLVLEYISAVWQYAVVILLYFCV